MRIELNEEQLQVILDALGTGLDQSIGREERERIQVVLDYLENKVKKSKSKIL